MNSVAAAEPDARRSGRIRLVGIALLVALAAVIGREAAFTAHIRSAWFDACQILAPRIPQSMPVTVVEIDQKSLQKIGQWPWPRTVMAELVDAIRRERPAAIALDILMPEADALSPERVLARAGKDDEALARALAGRPSNDAVLARALADAGAILVVAGMPEADRDAAARSAVHRARCGRNGGGGRVRRAEPRPVPGRADQHRRAGSRGVRTRPHLGRSRRRHRPARSAGRQHQRHPRAGARDRNAADRASARRRCGCRFPAATVQGIAIGDFAVPTEGDGAVRIYYSRRMPNRFVSAIDVLEGRVDPARLQQKLVLIGVTGLGLLDYQNTPVGERMPGSEIHAQLVENLFDQTLLRRPAWAPRARDGAVPPARGVARRRDAALEAAQRGAAHAGRRRAAGSPRVRRPSARSGCCSTRRRPPSA